jgi:hypothetical protein
MPPAKKVAIKVYVPAGDYCEGYTYKCPMLQDGHAGAYCVIIPDAFWLLHPSWIKKHTQCPSLLAKGNKLTEKDVVNERLRTFKKAAKQHREDEILDSNEDDEGFGVVN